MKVWLTLGVGIATLSGCTDAKQHDSEIIRNQVGRWVFVQASNDYPAFLLETTTGCLSTVTKRGEGQVVFDEVKFPNGRGNCDGILDIPTVDTRK